MSILTDEELRDALRTCPPDAIEPLRTRWLYVKDFARAIESAVIARLSAGVSVEPVAWMKQHNNGSVELNEYRTFVHEDAILTGRVPLCTAEAVAAARAQENERCAKAGFFTAHNGKDVEGAIRALIGANHAE